MKDLLIVCCACLTYISGFAQNNKVIIGTKKVLLKYGIQKDSLLLPMVSADYPALQKALSDTVVFSGDKLPDIVENYSQCGCGTTSFSYKVEFSNNTFVSMRLFYEGMGAYPTSYQKWLTLFIADGKPQSLNQAIGDEGVNFLFKKYKTILLSRINRDRLQYSKEPDAKYAYDTLLKAAKDLKPDDISKNFLVTPRGFMITTDDVLPHVIKSFEPAREVLFTFAQLKKLGAYSTKPGWHRTIRIP
jgi:hypothetical protein